VTATQEAVQYLYENVGFALTPAKDSATYLYLNVGFRTTPDSDAETYIYLDVVDPPALIPLSCHPPVPDSVHVYLNGIEQQETVDWIWDSGMTTVILTPASGCITGDEIEVYYACEGP
jgi:hypothetical protein